MCSILEFTVIGKGREAFFAETKNDQRMSKLKSSRSKTDKRVIEEHEKIVLSDADGKVFFNALNNPPKPNRELKSAFERHKQAGR
jgi:uncharacterized protein (DUF1778 family)